MADQDDCRQRCSQKGVEMSNDIPAFPLNTPEWHESVSDAGLENHDFTMGMTLRDYFAAKAMQAWESRKDLDDIPDVAKARRFYELADAMMKVREA